MGESASRFEYRTFRADATWGHGRKMYDCTEENAGGKQQSAPPKGHSNCRRDSFVFFLDEIAKARISFCDKLFKSRT